MELQVRLFATLKDRVGQPHIQVTVPTPATVQSLLDALPHQYPQLMPALKTAIVAVNKAFASPHTLLEPGDEVALFPPVSGGTVDTYPFPTFFAVTSEPVDITAVHQQLSRPHIGAIVSFTGFVRGQTNRTGLPATTLYLEYEAYAEMAPAKMGQIAHEIWQQWPQVEGVAIVQRIGRLDVGQITTFVACAAGHRDQGVFAAARYGIDRLKEIVPIWKKEVGPDQSIWVEGHYQPTDKDNKLHE